jgi:chromosome segregation ATPase
VDNDETAKRLLEKYKNLRRITCIPLNRIQAQEISDHVKGFFITT